MSTRPPRLLDKLGAFRYRYFVTPQLKLLSGTILEDFSDQKIWEKYERDGSVVIKDIFQYWWIKIMGVPRAAEYTIIKIVE